MKLTNPTDDELSEVFADRIARLPTKGFRQWIGGDLSLRTGPHIWPAYTNSADAVLPWLEKCKTNGLWVKIYDHTNGIASGERDWLVSISNRNESDENFEAAGWKFWEGTSSSLPRAAVIALLRANGITVLFTK